MDISIDEETKDVILDLIHANKEIKGLKTIESSPVGYKSLVFITIEVDVNLSTFASHKLADDLENDINHIDKVYKSIVHVEPI